MTKRHERSDELFSKNTWRGVFLYIESVIADETYVKFSSMMQKNYSIIDQQVVTWRRDEAIAAARAILKHFGEGVE